LASRLAVQDLPACIALCLERALAAEMKREDAAFFARHAYLGRRLSLGAPIAATCALGCQTREAEQLAGRQLVLFEPRVAARAEPHAAV
jgi:hypothetical protein